MAKSTKLTRSIDPTELAYGGFQTAYGFFNSKLFGGSLSPCLITLRTHPKSLGYFSGDRFAAVHGKSKKPDSDRHTDEIAMNPMHFAERTPDDILSTLVHEMAHKWQHEHGKKPTRCYHDRQWAAKMKEIGLHPSHTGAVGGKETGPKMTHYIVSGGPFATACADFMKANEVAFYQDRAQVVERIKKAKKSGDDDDEDDDGEEDAPKSPGRIKFCCFGCKLNAWAKPSAKLRCDDCDRPLKPATDDED